jgi:hypothetical protein
MKHHRCNYEYGFNFLDRYNMKLTPFSIQYVYTYILDMGNIEYKTRTVEE